MDVVFLIDTTTSMIDALDRVQIDLRKLIQDTAIPSSGGDLRLGLITFNDSDLPPDSVDVRAPLTRDINAVLNQVMR